MVQKLLAQIPLTGAADLAHPHSTPCSPTARRMGARVSVNAHGSNCPPGLAGSSFQWNGITETGNHSSRRCGSRHARKLVILLVSPPSATDDPFVCGQTAHKETRKQTSAVLFPHEMLSGDRIELARSPTEAHFLTRSTAPSFPSTSLPPSLHNIVWSSHYTTTSSTNDVVDAVMASPHRATSPSHFSWRDSAQIDTEPSFGHHPTPGSHPYPTHTPHYPHSPPPLNHWRSPYGTISLPPQGPVINLSAILRRNRVPAITWNILSPAHSAHCPTALTPHWRAAWASTPPQRSLDIRTSLIDRPIVVFSSAQTFVTIGDVLEGISRAIRDVDRGRSSLFGFGAGQEIQGDAVRPAASRLLIGVEQADHQTGASDHRGGASTRPGDSARAFMWDGLVGSPTEREVWILFVH